MMGITGAFSSLGINEGSRNSQENFPKQKFSKNCSTVSLPNMVLSERQTISSKFIGSVCDDEVETSEQPVDFSKKYCETKGTRSCTFNNVVKSYNNSFTMYAETDLDQPTDYSLRYAEDDSDSDRCKLAKTETTEFVQDTIKTYCTEDTPYETPFNFSTSTSMSDLRIDDKVPINNKLNGPSPKENDVTVIAKEISNSHQSKIKSEFSSGLMSPEKPVNYCEEGTPGYFSRVASCGSLNSIPVNDPPKPESKESALEVSKKEIRKISKFPSETKAVKFEEVVNYAEETPLMFSRSSSLASLDSIEQHSIHDDRSSVVSDFSRLTSGVISPSELPDSPSQTVPPSPKPRKTVIVFPTVPKKETETVPKTVENVPKSSVFEDIVKKFKVESTPLHFSSATSLSSLIDDEIDGKVGLNQEPHEGVVEIKNGIGEELNDLSEDSDDEDILAACINIGMQSNRYSQPKADSPPPSKIPPTFKFTQHSDIVNLNTSRRPLQNSSKLLPEENDLVQKTDVTSDSLRTYCTEGTPAVLSHAGSNSDLSILSMHLDEKTILRNDPLANDKNDLLEPESNPTETAHEDAPEESEKEEIVENHSRRSSFSSLSDDSHESDQALLEECMLAGMPKGNSPCKSTVSTLETPEMKTVGNVVDGLSDEEDEDILEDCIKIGIESNRYTHPKLNNHDVVNDTVKSYCTEDTPAVLSHAGSCSNLSVLSAQGTENGTTNYFSDVNSNFSDEDDEKLLEECVKYGMAAVSGQAKVDNNRPRTTEDKTQNLSKDEVNESSSSDDSLSISSLSDDTYEAEQALLQQCIQAGMPKSSKPPQEESSDLTPTEKALLQQCILEGMKKCRAVPKKPSEEESPELTEAEQALLRQCILSGMPKNKHLFGKPSSSRESTELTQSERLLLQQCILAGMPKIRNKPLREAGGSKQWLKRSKELEKSTPEHTCCIHCPRNNKARQSGHVKGRKKYRERGVVQVRESRDVNIVYVTSQILTVKKEVVDRTREKWV